MEDEGSQSLMAFDQVGNGKTITSRLGKLCDDNVAELCSSLTSVEKLSLTTDPCTAFTTES